MARARGYPADHPVALEIDAWSRLHKAVKANDPRWLRKWNGRMLHFFPDLFGFGVMGEMLLAACGERTWCNIDRHADKYSPTRHSRYCIECAEHWRHRHG